MFQHQKKKKKDLKYTSTILFHIKYEIVDRFHNYFRISKNLEKKQKCSLGGDNKKYNQQFL